MPRTSRQAPPAGQAVYEIAIQGGLDCHWSEWFDGLTVTRDENDNTILCGSIPDQAALRGVLLRVFDLGLALLSVNQIGLWPEGQDAEHPSYVHTP